MLICISGAIRVWMINLNKKINEASEENLGRCSEQRPEGE